MKKFDNKQLQRLEKKARYWFLKGLENDVVPSVMRCLPEHVEFEVRSCFEVGVSRGKVNYLLKRAWDEAYKIYEARRKYF